MSRSLSTVHIRTVDPRRVERWLADRLIAAGYTDITDRDDETDTARHVALVHAGGWLTIVDDDLAFSPGSADVLAHAASEALDTDALAVEASDFDGPQVHLARYRAGAAVGVIDLPDDEWTDERTGHRYLGASFLADLAIDEAAATSLTRVPADAMFVTAAPTHIAGALGLVGGVLERIDLHRISAPIQRRRFTPPATPTPEAAWPAAEAFGDVAATTLHLPDRFVGLAEAPIQASMLATLQAHHGPPVHGLVLELRGTALALLDLTAISAWNSREVVTTAAVEREASAVRARFPDAFVTPAGMPSLPLDGLTAAAMRTYADQLATMFGQQAHFRLEGRYACAGSGELEWRVTDSTGAAVPGADARTSLEVAPAPRRPARYRSRAHDDEHALAREFEALAAYAGSAWITGYVPFGGTWAEASEALLACASQVLRVAAAEAPREFTLTIDVRQPSAPGAFAANDDLRAPRLTRVVEHLARGGTLSAHAPHDGATTDGGFVEVGRRQPSGGGGDGPLAVRFALPAARGAAALATLEHVLRDAASQASCLGGYLAAEGAIPHQRPAFVELADTWRDWERSEWLAAHAVAPGWRTIVPTAAVAVLVAHPSVTITPSACGALVASNAATPLAMTDDDRAAMEDALAAAL